MITGYRQLIVWQKAMELVDVTYELTDKLPSIERYGLCVQMRKSVSSIPSNIAEGRGRGTRKDFRHFLVIAFASGAELETQLEICSRRSLGMPEKVHKAQSILQEVMKMLNVMIRKLEAIS